MVKALFDTNILIDHLRGIPAARDELQRHQDKAISIVTWMEIMVGASPALLHGTQALLDGTQALLDGFTFIEIDRRVAERAVTLRRTHRIKLPDAIVWASAQVHAMLFVTRDARDFRADDPGIRMPYRV
jgi:predicted nucleic acid-binding protein